jgi:1,2-diacylglycerol 3-beta-glucosyltransferase
MHLSGVGIRYTSRAAVTQQAVVDVRRLTRQRTRWAQGNLQCARYLRQLVTSKQIGLTSLAEVLHYLFSPWINALVTVVLAGMVAISTPGWSDLAAGGAVWLGITWFPGFLWALVHRYRLRDETLPRLFLAAVAYPAFLLLGLVATYRAIARQATGRQAWAKTERLAEEPLPTSALALAA